MKGKRWVLRLNPNLMSSVVILLLSAVALEARAMDIDAGDAHAEMGETTMTLKRVHSGGSDYIFHMIWNAANNTWKTVSYEPDYGYGWRPEARIPTGTYWAGSAVKGKKLYVIGGADHWDKISTYNATTNTWTEKTVSSMGFLLRAATIGDNIHIFDTSDPGEACWIYNLKTKTMAPMGITPPNLEWTSEPAIYNGKLYFFGGYGPLKTTWEFNPTTLTFKKKADMPTAGYGSSTAVLNGKIYVIGGNYRFNKIEIYNPKTNTWAQSLSFSKLALWGWDTATPLGGKIAIVEANMGSTYLFDPVTKTLTAQESMPMSHGDYLTGEGLNGRLYVAGGMCGQYSLDSFKPKPPKGTLAGWSPTPEGEMSTVPEPNYRAVEAMHLHQMEQARGEAAPKCSANE
jgi:N-acetylneuraminic acid mutarotase